MNSKDTTYISFIHRCGSVTRKIIRSKTGFLYEGLKMGGVGDDIKQETAQEEELMETLGAASRRRRGAAEEREKCELNPQQLKEHFRGVYSQDPQLLNELFPVFKQTPGLSTPTDLFFMEVLAVPPPR